jgi:hypothetical protein
MQHPTAGKMDKKAPKASVSSKHKADIPVTNTFKPNTYSKSLIIHKNFMMKISLYHQMINSLKIQNKNIKFPPISNSSTLTSLSKHCFMFSRNYSNKPDIEDNNKKQDTLDALRNKLSMVIQKLKIFLTFDSQIDNLSKMLTNFIDQTNSNIIINQESIDNLNKVIQLLEKNIQNLTGGNIRFRERLSEIKSQIRDIKAIIENMRGALENDRASKNTSILTIVKEEPIFENLTKWFFATDLQKKPMERFRKFSGNLLLLILLIALAMEFYEYFFPNEKFSTVNPQHRLPTKIAQKILNLLYASEYDLGSNDIDDIEPLHAHTIINKPGIYFLTLIGGSGTGKSVALDDVRLAYEQRRRSSEIIDLYGNSVIINLDCNSVADFEYQIIKIAIDKGMNQVNGYNLTLGDAHTYLSKYLSEHPGWMITFDNVTDSENSKMVKDFLLKISDSNNQSGKVVIATSNVDIDKSKFEVSDKIICVHDHYNLNSPKLGFNEKYAYALFEKLLHPLYKNEELTYAQKFLKGNLIFQYIRPGYPHTDKKLKEELVKHLGFSPQAIQMATSYIIMECKQTGKSPELAMSTYLHELNQILDLEKDRSLFGNYEYLKDEIANGEKINQQNLRHHKLNEAVYTIALRKLDNIGQNSVRDIDKKVAKDALDVIPLCVALNPKHLYLRYVEAFLKSKNVESKDEITVNHVLQVVECLYNYGILKRYFKSSRVAENSDYDKFHIQSLLSDAYFSFKAIKADKKDPKFEKMSLKEIKNALMGDNVKNIMNFTSDWFHLSNPLLKVEGLEWQYASHCLWLLENKLINHNENITNDLKLATSAMNISVQYGYILELNLLSKKVNKLIQKMQDNNLIPIKPQVVFDYKRDLIDKNVNSNKEISEFCESLHKFNPLLPSLYAEYIYYNARKVVKVTLDSEEMKKSLQDMHTAYLMRKVIDAAKFPNVPKMNHDTLTFQRDGLGVYFLTQKNEEDLKLAENYYKELLPKGDSHHQFKCNLYLSEINCQLANLNFKNGNKENDKLNELVEKSKHYLSESELLKNNILIQDEKLFAKVLRYHLVKAELERTNAKLTQALSTKNEHLNNSIRELAIFVENAGYDQKSDLIKAYISIAKSKLTKTELDYNMPIGTRIEYLNDALEAIKTSIKFQTPMKTDCNDVQLKKSYQIESKIEQICKSKIERFTDELIATFTPISSIIKSSV